MNHLVPGTALCMPVPRPYLAVPLEDLRTNISVLVVEEEDSGVALLDGICMRRYGITKNSMGHKSGLF